MKALSKFLSASVFIGVLAFTSCKKPDTTTQPIPKVDTGCPSWNIRVDGKCTFDTANWFRDELGSTLPRWMRDSLWTSFNKCTLFDSTYIFIRPVDPDHTNVRFLGWTSSKIEGTYSGGLISGNLPVNYWPSPVLGDSVEWDMPFLDDYFVIFNGRFNLTQDTLRGMLRYKPVYNKALPALPPCGPVMFRKVRVMQMP